MIKIFFLASLVVLFGCTKDNSKQDIKELQLDVDSLLTDWHKNAAEAHYEGYFGLMDSVSVFIGTDATENWTKQEFAEFCKPHFAKGKAWEFKTIDRNIYCNSTGEVIWFDELLETWMGICRGSGVLEIKNEEWKMKHYVLSVSVPNDVIKEVIDVKHLIDSTQMDKMKSRQ